MVTDFVIDYSKLNAEVAEYGITAIPCSLMSKRIEVSDVPYISDYFKGERLTWVDKFKQYGTVVFINNDCLTDEIREMIAQLYVSVVDNPEIDKQNIVAKILALYPCYTALIVSYKSSDIKKANYLCTEIVCRANTVTIKQDNYKYHHEDMV